MTTENQGMCGAEPEADVPLEQNDTKVPVHVS
jgi:hypothetical protein